MSLSWTAPADDSITGYLISRQGPSDASMQSLSETSQTNYEDRAVAAATQYEYQVKSVSAVGESPAFSVTVTTQPAPAPEPTPEPTPAPGSGPAGFANPPAPPKERNVDYRSGFVEQVDPETAPGSDNDEEQAGVTEVTATVQLTSSQPRTPRGAGRVSRSVVNDAALTVELTWTPLNPDCDITQHETDPDCPVSYWVIRDTWSYYSHSRHVRNVVMSTAVGAEHRVVVKDGKLSWTDTGVRNTQTYWYHIRAEYSDDWKTFQNGGTYWHYGWMEHGWCGSKWPTATSSHKSESRRVQLSPETAAPSRPRNLSASVGGNRLQNVTLRWDRPQYVPSSPGVCVYHGHRGGATSLRTFGPITATTWTDDNVAPERTHNYIVWAVCDGKKSLGAEVGLHTPPQDGNKAARRHLLLGQDGLGHQGHQQ